MLAQQWIFIQDGSEQQEHSENADLPQGSTYLKISSKSVHNFLSYLSLKITFHGSRRSR